MKKEEERSGRMEGKGQGSVPSGFRAWPGRWQWLDSRVALTDQGLHVHSTDRPRAARVCTKS